MTDDVYRRLRAQTLLLSALRAEASLTADDYLLADVERIHLRSHDDAARELLRRLEVQSEAQAAALEHAANVRRHYADALNGQARAGVELDQILSATDGCHGYNSTAMYRDEASTDQEREVLRLLQVATLQIFG